MTSTNSLTGKKIFGAGRPYGINNTTNPTPIQFAVPQSQTVTFKRSNKTLHGENQLPAAVGSGEMTISGKITFGASSARVMSDLFFNMTGSKGTYTESRNEPGTIPSATTFTVTVVNADTFVIDLGVIYASTNATMTRVAPGSEVAGTSYSVSDVGVYTFAAGDASKNVKISYLSKDTSTGEMLTISNPLQGKTGNFTAVHVFPWGTEKDVFVLNSCLASNSEYASKSGDFGKPTLDYDASCDDDEELGTFTFAQAA